MVLYFLCVSEKVCERKAMGNSVPSCSWDNCALQASSDALVYTMHCLLEFGYHRIGAWMIDSLTVKKALWWVGVQSNFTCWHVRSVNGLAILAKFLINFLQYPTKPRRHGLVWVFWVDACSGWLECLKVMVECPLFSGCVLSIVFPL